MDAEDLQNLYSELRGSRAAPAIMDARSLFLDLQYEAALGKLRESYDKYSESRMRILRQDAEKQVDAKAKDRDRQVKRIKRKQDKAKEILETYEELFPQLEKLIEKQRKKDERKREQAKSREEQSTTESSVKEPVGEDEVEDSASEEKDSTSQEQAGADGHSAEQTPVTASDIDSSFTQQFAAATFDEQVSLVGTRFGFRPVSSAQDIQVDAVYFLCGDEDSILVNVTSAESDEPIELVNLATEGMFQVPAKIFLEFGEQRKVVLLLLKDSGDEKQLSADEGATDPERDKILDRGALSQLMDSAQRCGLVPGADQIAYVRDKEFRLGQYEQALQVIESMYGKFTAGVAQRSQRLMREDADIAAGRVTMSPKEIQAKRQRDRAQDQAIERARSRFNRVLDGLRVLMKVGV